MTPKRAFEIANTADRVSDLLTHAGWKDELQPELNKLRLQYCKLLTNSVLGQKATYITPAGPIEMTPEQIAGRIYGIDFIETLITQILTRGARAIKELDLPQLTATNSTT